MCTLYQYYGDLPLPLPLPLIPTNDVKADAYLQKELATALHDLYLTLMADQPFKTRIAAAYVRALPVVTANYARGVGTADYA